MHLPPQQTELRRRVDEILYYLWDPIGVAWEEQTRNEYEPYVHQVLTLLAGGAGEVEIASHLDEIAKDRMGLTPDEGRTLAVAKLLVRLRAFTSGSADL